MQVFRLMGMPDSVIAFDELPSRFLDGLEMRAPDGFPRQWKEWMGKKTKVTRISPERDPITLQVRTFPPIVEEGPFFYMIDWELNSNKERWQEICDFARQHVSKDTRLKERIEEMAVDLARDPKSELSLQEPETEVPIIPIPLEYQEKPLPALITPASDPLPRTTGENVVPKVEITKVEVIKQNPPCEDCGKEFSSKQALRMHRMKKHSLEKVTA